MSDVSTAVAYNELATAIIQKQASILGMNVALKRARNVAGLDIDDTGHVSALSGDPNQVIADLVDQYKSLSGSVGVEFCKQAAKAWLNSHANMQLPPAVL